jgi:hypothetical protein
MSAGSLQYPSCFSCASYDAIEIVKIDFIFVKYDFARLAYQQGLPKTDSFAGAVARRNQLNKHRK